MTFTVLKVTGDRLVYFFKPFLVAGAEAPVKRRSGFIPESEALFVHLFPHRDLLVKNWVLFLTDFY